jgi:tRNA pseudouridine38-40 synthase
LSKETSTRPNAAGRTFRSRSSATPRQRDAGDSARGKPRVLRATIEYDGGRYRGWQAQINARTVQGTLYGAVSDLLGRDVRIMGAGRTDAGVHAFAQVASIHLPLGAADVGSLETLRSAVNDRLPPDIHVLSLAPAGPSFHARHDALVRVYRYRISLRRTAFGKPFVWWVKEPLDVASMSSAASLFVGRHDFSSFCDNAEGHESTLVEVSAATVAAAASVPDLLLFRITASHYLWKMVRRLVGTLVEVGAGRLSSADVKKLLGERSPKPAEWTAPPSGLFLESVTYAGDPPPREIDPLRPAF